MKRILSIEGGGIRGILELELLLKIENLIQEKFGEPLHKHFDLIAGTSTGAIIATLISWGYSIPQIQDFYMQNAQSIFRRAPIRKLHRHKYSADELGNTLRDYLVEDNGELATLGTSKLHTLLLIIIRNATTGSTWPVCNNPKAKYNNRELSDCNLDLILCELVRASTAAPTYFEPEPLMLGKEEFQFIDGGISPHNNPSIAAFLHATLPEYRIGFPIGPDELYLLSVGTGMCNKPISPEAIANQNILAHTKMAVNLLMNSVTTHEDVLCRVLGKCLFGDPIDSEIGDLCGDGPLEKQFSYTRYNPIFTPDEIRPSGKKPNLLEMDNMEAIPFLIESGKSYAEKSIREEHLI